MSKAKVIKALREHFEDIELWYDRSAASWVFAGECTERWADRYACVYRLSDLTPEQWVDLALDFSARQSFRCNVDNHQI